MFRLMTPKTDDEWERYYGFRWQILRAPWQLPKGSEREAYDNASIHRMIVDNKQNCVAIGRLYMTPDNEGQVRFIAVDPAQRGNGMGSWILMALEGLAQQEGAKRLVCNAREDAIGFFAKYQFVSQGELSEERGPIRHQQMLKYLSPLQRLGRHSDWCDELQNLWYTSMPISEQMGMVIRQYTGGRLQVAAKMDANLNPHAAMFSGSIFTMATLAGWGLVWMLLKEQDLSVDIVLVDAQIRYKEPLFDNPNAVAAIEKVSGDLGRVSKNRKGRLWLEVDVFSDDHSIATFHGTYLLLPISQPDNVLSP